MRRATRTTTIRRTSTHSHASGSRPRGSTGTRSRTSRRAGHECRHNLLYWRQGDYLGIGCAAHSHRDGRRWWNVRTPERYIDAITSGVSPEAASEQLDAEERELERLQLALRTRDGIPIDALPIEDVDLDGLIDVRGDRALLTTHGRLLANEVAVRLRHASTAGSSIT